MSSKPEIINNINSAIKNSPNPELNSLMVIAVKQQPSGDLKLYANSKQDAETLIRHRGEWQKALGKDAKVKVPTYGVIVHGVSTQLEAYNTAEMAERIQWSNPSLQSAIITYTGWLKRDVEKKRASSLVVEFESPIDADHAIINGLVLGAELLACEYYDRYCKLKHCFRRQRYGHVGTHCRAMVTCGYCAGHHDTRACEEKSKKSKSEAKCANCSRNHQAWNPHCAVRQEAYRKLEEYRRTRPSTHQEAGALLLSRPTAPTATEPAGRRKRQNAENMPAPRPTTRSQAKGGQYPTGTQKEPLRRTQSGSQQPGDGNLVWLEPQVYSANSQGAQTASLQALREMDPNQMPTRVARDVANHKKQVIEQQSQPPEMLIDTDDE
jgi:hypothetical protein